MEDQSSSKRRKVGEGDTSSQNLSGIQDRSGAGGDVLPAGTKLTEEMFMIVKQKDEFQKLLLEGEEIKGASEEQKSASRAIAVSTKFNDFLYEFGKMVVRNWKNKGSNSVKRLVDSHVTLEDVEKFHESTATVKSTKFYTFMNQAALACYDPEFEELKKKYSVIWDRHSDDAWKKWYKNIYCKKDDIKKPPIGTNFGDLEKKAAYAFRTQLGMSDVQQCPTTSGDDGADSAGPDSKVLVQVKNSGKTFDDFSTVFTAFRNWPQDWKRMIVTNNGFTEAFKKKAEGEKYYLFNLKHDDNTECHLTFQNKLAEQLMNDMKNRLSAASASSSTAGATSASLALLTSEKKPRRHKSGNGPKRVDVLPEIGITYWAVGKYEGRTTYMWKCEKCYPGKPQGPGVKSHIEHAEMKHKEAYNKARVDRGIPKKPREKNGDVCADKPQDQ